MTIAFLLLIAALICFLLDTFGVAARVSLQSLGLAFMVLASLVGGASLG